MTSDDEVERLLEQTGIDRHHIDMAVRICEQAFFAGMTDEQIAERIRDWINWEMMRRHGPTH